MNERENFGRNQSLTFPSLAVHRQSSTDIHTYTYTHTHIHTYTHERKQSDEKKVVK